MFTAHSPRAPAPATLQMGQPCSPGASVGQRQQTDHLQPMRDADDGLGQDSQFADFGVVEVQAQG